MTKVNKSSNIKYNKLSQADRWFRDLNIYLIWTPEALPRLLGLNDPVHIAVPGELESSKQWRPAIS